MSQINFTSRRQAVDVATNKTLAAADQGIVQNVTASANVTLPAAAAGLEFVIRVGADTNPLTVNITPNGTDTVAGLGFTAAASKGAVSTNGRMGDEITLAAGAGQWNVIQAQGVWTRQP